MMSGKKSREHGVSLRLTAPLAERRRGHRRRERLLLPVLGLLAACGPGREKAAPATHLLEALRPLAGTRRGDRSLGVLEVPADLGEWAIGAPRIQVVEAGGARALHLVGKQQHLLRIPIGELRPNLVLVEVIGSNSFTLRCGLNYPASPGSQGRVPSDAVGFTGPGKRGLHAFPLHDDPIERAGPAELLLVPKSPHGLDWTLVRVELFERTLASRLPAVGEEPLMVERDGDGRMSFGLAGGEAIGARIEVPEGGVLSFCALSAPGVPALDLALVVRAGSTRGAATQRLRIEVGSASWHEARVELADLGGSAAWIELAAEGRGVAAVSELVLARPRAAPATVLLVTSDTHRADHVGYADAAPVTTPTLDRLAQEGVAFLDCLASSNVTLASHAALFTGLTPHDTGILDNSTRLARRAETLADRFHAAGWATRAVVSARHLRDSWSGLGQGFERMDWPNTSERDARSSIDRALAGLESVRQRPLFLWLHLFDAHRPYTPPDDFLEPYWPAGRDPFDQTLPRLEVPSPPFLRDLRDLEFPFALYRGEISYLDRELERLLTLPRLERAIVAVTSDHGECFGENGLWWDHVGVYPNVLHVPLVLRWPGAPAGTVVKAGVRQIDLSHTLLALAELDLHDFPGRDLREALGESTEEGRPRFAVGSFGQGLALTEGRWHFIVNLHGKGYKRDLAQVDLVRDQPLGLFDLRTDPACQNDLAKSQPERMRAMARRLWRWARSAPVGGLAEVNVIDEEASALLGALGYAAGATDASSIDLELLAERLGSWVGDETE